MGLLSELLGEDCDDLDINISIRREPHHHPSRKRPFSWKIGPITEKTSEPTPGPLTGGSQNRPAQHRHHHEGEITLQLQATQQVALAVSAQDRYGNPVTVAGNLLWTSSDESVITLDQSQVPVDGSVTAVTTGAVGSAAVTVTDDVNGDGTGDYIGSLAIDVVAGPMSEIVVTAGTPVDKSQPAPPPPEPTPTPTP